MKQIQNFVKTQLAANLLIGDTSLTVKTGHGNLRMADLVSNFDIVVYNSKWKNATDAYWNVTGVPDCEIITVGTRTADVCSGLVRARQGTTELDFKEPGQVYTVEAVSTSGLFYQMVYKFPVKAATTVNITRANEQTIDGIALVAGDRVLVKNQTLPKENGIFVVVDGGNWTRDTDFDDAEKIESGSLVFIISGTVNGLKIYHSAISASPFVVDTDDITYALVNGDTLGSLSPAENDLAQYKSGNWIPRTVEQYAIDLAEKRVNTIELFDHFVAPRLNGSGAGATTTDSVLCWRHTATPNWYGTGDARRGVIGLSYIVAISQSYFFLDASANGVLFTTSNSPGFGLLGNLISKFRMVRKLPTLDNGAQTQYIGFFNTTTFSTSYGAYFYVVGTGTVHCVTKTAAGNDDTDTGVTWAADVFKVFEIRTNAAGTTVYFYIDGVLVATHSTYIFDNTLRFGFGENKTNASGNGSETYIDYFYLFISGL